MIGRKVESKWHGVCGVVTKWEPTGTSMCDTLVQCSDGIAVWISSRDLKPTDGLGDLPSRDSAVRQMKVERAAALQKIYANFVIAHSTHERWPGAEWLRGIAGISIGKALAEAEAEAERGNQ